MPTFVDYAFVLLFAVLVTLYEVFVYWPRFRAAVATGVRGARVRGYRRIIAGEWLFAIVCLGIWLGAGRPLADLRLTTPAGWRLATGISIIVVLGFLITQQLRAVARMDDTQRTALRTKFGELSYLLPHAPDEAAWFTALAVTAGICEELLYRGYLVWVLQPWLGAAGAMAASVLLFGLGHGYQGKKQFVKATLAGAVMGAIVIVTGWLVPAMIVHALIDVSSGALGYKVLRQDTFTSVTDARAV